MDGTWYLAVEERSGVVKSNSQVPRLKTWQGRCVLTEMKKVGGDLVSGGNTRWRFLLASCIYRSGV